MMRPTAAVARYLSVLLLIPAVALACLSGCGSENGSDEGAGRGGWQAEVLQRLGTEAEGAERRAIIAAEHRYFSALEGGHLDQLCSLLSKSVIDSLDELAGGEAKSPGCPVVLASLLAKSGTAQARRQANGTITAVRVKASRAVVVMRVSGGNLYVLPMRNEQGRWKATTVGASPLTPSTG